MFKVIYDPEFGQIVPDADIESFVKSYIDNHSRNAKVRVGSETLFTRFRVAVAEGDLDFESVEFYFKGELIKHRADGSLERWPKGMCDYYGNYVRRITACRRPRNFEEDLLWSIIHNMIAHPLMAITIYKWQPALDFHNFTAHKAWKRK